MPVCAVVQLVSLLIEISNPVSLSQLIFDQTRHFSKLASDMHKYSLVQFQFWRLLVLYMLHVDLMISSTFVMNCARKMVMLLVGSVN
jgi:hypothetical protein